MTKERILPPLLLLLLWQGLSGLGVIPDYKLPSPVQVLQGLYELIFIGMPPGHLLPNHILFSLIRVASGFILAAALAVPLGLLMGWSRRLKNIVSPLLELIRPVPPLAWIPIVILLVMAVVVGFILISLYLPMFSLQMGGGS